MDRLLKKFCKSRGGATGPAPATSVMSSKVLASPAIASAPIVQAASTAIAGHELGVSTPTLVAKSNKSNDPSLTTANTLCSSSKPAISASTSTIETSAVDIMTRFSASPETASVQVIRAASATTAHVLGVSAPAIGGLTPVAHLLPSSPDTMMEANSESEQNRSNQHSGSRHFKNVLITGGTCINCDTCNVVIPPVNTGKGQIKVPASQKPNSSQLFTGRRDVLDKLGKIFVHRANSSPRRSCLLWGMGGIGKTQICLRFTEEMADNFFYVFWVDASSYESMKLSLKGLSSIPAAQASGVDSSVESALQWISHIQEEWLIIFDNADDPSPGMVAKFVPLGNRGNVLITSRN